MLLVINEWIFHDLLMDNGRVAFKETEGFVNRLFSSDDRIVMPDEDRWKRKAYQLMTASSPVQRQVSRLFHRLLRDPDRCLILSTAAPRGASPGAYDWSPPEDVYLIEAYVASGADLLVTTDVPLFDAIAEYGQFTCQMRDDFISEYISTQPSSQLPQGTRAAHSQFRPASRVEPPSNLVDTPQRRC